MRIRFHDIDGRRTTPFRIGDAQGAPWEGAPPERSGASRTPSPRSSPSGSPTGDPDTTTEGGTSRGGLRTDLVGSWPTEGAQRVHYLAHIRDAVVVMERDVASDAADREVARFPSSADFLLRVRRYGNGVETVAGRPPVPGRVRVERRDPPRGSDRSADPGDDGRPASGPRRRPRRVRAHRRRPEAGAGDQRGEPEGLGMTDVVQPVPSIDALPAWRRNPLYRDAGLSPEFDRSS